MGKRELRDKVVTFAKECESDPARYSQATASILFGLAAALSADTEEVLMQQVAKFAQGEVNRLTAARN